MFKQILSVVISSIFLYGCTNTPKVEPFGRLPFGGSKGNVEKLIVDSYDIEEEWGEIRSTNELEERNIYEYDKKGNCIKREFYKDKNLVYSEECKYSEDNKLISAEITYEYYSDYRLVQNTFEQSDNKTAILSVLNEDGSKNIYNITYKDRIRYNVSADRTDSSVYKLNKQDRLEFVEHFHNDTLVSAVYNQYDKNLDLLESKDISTYVIGREQKERMQRWEYLSYDEKGNPSEAYLYEDRKPKYYIKYIYIYR